MTPPPSAPPGLDAEREDPLDFWDGYERDLAGLLRGQLAGAGRPRPASAELFGTWGRILDPDVSREAIPFPEFASRPVPFLREVLRVEFLTKEQREICRRVEAKPETTVQAGHNVGKSFVAAGLTIWWVFAVGGLCITTAPTMALVNDVLWKEVRSLYGANSSKLGGEQLKTRLYLTEEARAYGYTANKSEHGVSFAGRHARRLLAIQDEASGIEKPIDDAFDTLTGAAGNRSLRIGNPLSTANPFYQHCRRPGTIKIPVWTHPNVSWAYREREDGAHELKPEVAERLPRDEEGNVADEREWPPDLQRSVVPGAVSVQWIERETAKPSRGPGTAWYVMRLDGEFVDDPVESLIPRSWFRKARARYDADPERWDAAASRRPWEHGLDVGDGRDPHAKVSRRGPVLYEARVVATKGDMKDTDRAVALATEKLDRRWGPVKVDRHGPGQATVNAIRKVRIPHLKPPAYEDWSERERRVKALPVSFGGRASTPELFTNLKAEAFWRLRESFEREEIAVAPLGDAAEQRLMEELAAIQYERTAADKIRIESKDITRARLGRSPDLADAAAYAFWNAGGFGEITIGGYRPSEL